MGDGVIEEILQVEQQIRRRLAVEQAAGVERQKALREQLEATARAEQGRLAREEQEALDRYRRQAEAAAERIVEEAAAVARRWQEWDDQRLRRVLQRHLPKILPGSTHDHPDGQG